MTEGVITVEDPTAPDVRALIARHLEFARATTPPEAVFALDLDGLTDPAVTFFTYRMNDEVIGMAALKHLDDEHAELKSMHTAAEARGRGVGRALVDHIVAVARERGYRRISLETGSGPAFEAARSLYESANFKPCEAFSDYRPTPLSAYMTLSLDEGADNGE
jgi:putative acetyltransferase